GQWSPVFTTTVAVEAQWVNTRIVSASLGRAYWDNNTANAVGLVILNGNAGNAINTFINASAPATFSTYADHKLNVQLLDPNGSNNYGQAFSTVVNFDTTIVNNRLMSAALGRAYWDNNLPSAVGLIILNGNAGNAVNDFVNATAPQTFTNPGWHKLSVQLMDPNGLNNYSPPFTTVIKFDKALDSIRTIRVDAARIWIDNNLAGAISMLAFDGNFNQAVEEATQNLIATSPGLHTLNIQIRDSFPNQWGPVFKTVFSAETPLSYRNINIATGQLYWDNDTLNNNQTLIAFDGAYDNAIESALKNNAPVLNQGLHTLCVRFKDVAGNWSNPFRLSIVIDDSLYARNIKLVQGEVKVDDLPPLSIIALNGNFSAAVEQAQATFLSSGLPLGLHRLITRFKGLDGNWGKPFVTSILVSPCATSPMPVVTNNRPLQFCYGDSTVLTANAGFNTYTWLYNNTVVGNGPSFVARDSGFYSVVVTDGTNCPGASIPLLVNVHHPVVQITTGPVFCQGTTDSLLATQGFNSYNWSAGSVNFKQYISNSGTYSVTVTDGYGCTAQSSVAMVAQPLPPVPVITANGPLGFCLGSNVTLTSSSTTNILWNNGLSVPSFTTDTSGTYSVTVTGANGCKSTSSVIQTIRYPQASVSITPNGPTTFCNGQSVTLTASGGLVYNWSNGAHTQSVVVSSTGTYSLNFTDSNSCVANSSVVTVTVNPTPTVPVVSASGPLDFCNGSSVTLTTNAGAGHYWNTGSTSGTITIYSSGAFIDTMVNGFGCKSWSAPNLVNVHPTASITASGPTTFCFGGTVNLAAQPASGVSYAWSNGSVAQNVNITNTQNVSVIVSEPGGCKDTAYTNVLVHPLPTGSVTANGPVTVCSGNTVTLSASGSPHTYYKWYKNGSPILNYYYNINCSCYVPYFIYGTSYTTGTSGVYSVEIIDSVTGCTQLSNGVTVNILVPVQPVITANGGTTLCIGANTVLSSSPAVSYLWSTGATTQQITASTSGYYQVTTTDINGCQSTSANTLVTFFPTASITASGPTTFCAGNSVNLTAHPTGSYSWNTGSSNATLSNINSTSSYTVTVT
ncbi:MAG TPA: hypothetical protein PLP14_04985, partial [Chitinophagaceae bacterium]|nr:hypothetical protein [Chitinophagaceae bacterium]